MYPKHELWILLFHLLGKEEKSRYLPPAQHFFMKQWLVTRLSIYLGYLKVRTIGTTNDLDKTPSLSRHHLAPLGTVHAWHLI